MIATRIAQVPSPSISFYFFKRVTGSFVVVGLPTSEGGSCDVWQVMSKIR